MLKTQNYALDKARNELETIVQELRKNKENQDKITNDLKSQNEILQRQNLIINNEKNDLATNMQKIQKYKNEQENQDKMLNELKSTNDMLRKQNIIINEEKNERESILKFCVRE